MKFVQLALLGLVSVSAVRLRQKPAKPEGGDQMPSAEEIFAECDANADALLSMDEVKACMTKHGEEKHIPEMEAEWKSARPDGSALNMDELKAGMEAQAIPSKLAQKGSKGGESGEKPEGEHPPMPTAEEIFAECDADADALLSMDEVKACMTKHGEAEHIPEMEAEWKAARPDGSALNKEELAAGMEAKAIPASKLAQKGSKGGESGEKPEGEKPEGERPEGEKPEGEKPEGEDEGHHGPPSAEEIFAECDTNGDAMLSFDEVSACMQKHGHGDEVPEMEEEWREAKPDMGDINKEELEGAMEAHGEKPSGEKPSGEEGSSSGKGSKSGKGGRQAKE